MQKFHLQQTLYKKPNFESILMQENNYENSNISPCKNIIFKQTLYKQPKCFKLL
jgi:hypothetical protein